MVDRPLKGAESFPTSLGSRQAEAQCDPCPQFAALNKAQERNQDSVASTLLMLATATKAVCYIRMQTDSKHAQRAEEPHPLGE